ncbi:MAG: hypothetical protein WCL11_21325 [Verrucomicrobiota bacterium]
MRLPETGVAQPAQGPPTTLVCFGERQGPCHRITINKPAGRMPEPLLLEVRPHRVVQEMGPTLVLNRYSHKNMPFELEQLTRIFNRTSGYCHICHKKLCRCNYGQLGKRGAWEVEHSVPQCKGGSHHGNNLYAACIKCNRDKGKLTTRTVRGWNGLTKAPMSVKRREAARAENTFLGLVGGRPRRVCLGWPAWLGHWDRRWRQVWKLVESR